MVLITVIYMIVSVLLIIFVLLQKGDSGLGSIGGSSNTILGSARGTVMSKITYILATMFFLGAIMLSVLSSGSKSVIEKVNIENKEKTELNSKTATEKLEIKKEDKVEIKE